VRLASARLFTWGGPVPGQVRLASAAPSARRGLLLCVEGEGGAVGLGEAAPLPQLSSDTLEQDEHALIRLDWSSVELPVGLAELGGAYPRARGDWGAPAARFAFETALASAAASSAMLPLHRWLLADEAHRAGPVARSIYVGSTDDPGTLERAEARARGGATTLKIKRARATVREGVDVYLGELRARVGPSVQVRADENGQLSASEARAMADVYARHGVELVEEPCAPAEMVHLGALAVPFFADECLQDPFKRTRVLANPAVTGFVVKPTLLGGLREAWDLALFARAAGKSVVVTHAFEGPVALAACAELALALGSGPYGHGLDDHAAVAAFRAWPVPQLMGHPARVEPTQLRGLGLGAPDLAGLEEVWRWSR
jgi:L-alanine-DL-glutamate epimerase-like enolase superfamily enzyme